MISTLFAECVLPGCRNLVADPTQPCEGCLTAFGDMLQPTDRPLTAEQIVERDEQVRDAYRGQAAFLAQAEGRAARQAAIDAGEVKKANQVCWMCEERRACTKTPQGWECDACREVR